MGEFLIIFMTSSFSKGANFLTALPPFKFRYFWEIFEFPFLQRVALQLHQINSLFS
jgi:hypothetical protein